MAETRRSVQEISTRWTMPPGGASEVKPKFVSRSDPAAQWTGAMKGHAFFAYATNYLIDMAHAVIVDVEASRAIRQAEVGAARTMTSAPRIALAFIRRGWRPIAPWVSRDARVAGA
jgi:hypothetical protein